MLCLALSAARADPIHDAFARLYNFDFPGAHRILDRHIAANSSDPIGYLVRASAYLFYELDRMQILESEFFEDDRKIASKKGLKPDPGVRQKFFQSLDDARRTANAALAANPKDENALFVLAIANGLASDYMSLVEKRQLRSLAPAKESQDYAIRLLRIDPAYADAYLTEGVTEYLVGSLPFYLKWFVHFNEIQGSKPKAIQNLDQVAKSGRYLGPFARILLAIIYLREKQPKESQKLLEGLTREFPENPLLRKELAKITANLQSGRKK